MRFTSVQTDRAVSCAKMTGIWSLVLGAIVVAWAWGSFPWTEPDASPSDWQYVTVYEPGSAAPSVPVQKRVNVHESRSLKYELIGAVTAYILPGAALIFLSRSMTRHSRWACPAVCVIGFAFIAHYVVDVIGLVAGGSSIEQEPFIAETLLRPVGIFLIAFCLNAMPDLLRRRGVGSPRRGFQPLLNAPLAVIAPPRMPPRPAGLFRKQDRDGAERQG